MPSCGDPNFPSIGLFTGEKIINISLPCFLPDNWRISLFTPLDQIVPYHTISTVAGNTSQDTSRHPFTTILQGPFISCLAFLRKQSIKNTIIDWLLNDRAGTPAKLARQF